MQELSETLSAQAHASALRQPAIRKRIIISDWLKDYITLEPFMFARELCALGWEMIELSKLDKHDIQREQSIVLCITYDDFDIGALKCQNITLIYKIDDLYPRRGIRDRCIRSCDVLVGPYHYLFPRVTHMYGTITSKPSCWIPYSAVNEFFEPLTLNENPNNQAVLVSGAVGPDYPLRTLLRADSRFKDLIHGLDHPSYDPAKRSHDIVNHRYYQQLHQYLCCFCGVPSFNYILLKVFAITSVGSLLLIEDTVQEPFNTLGFFDMETCVFCNASNVHDKILWILDAGNRRQVDSIRKAGMELTRSKHTVRNRAELMNALSDDLIRRGDNERITLDTSSVESIARKSRFETIYEKNVWNDGKSFIPLSGPGSSLKNTEHISDFLTRFIYEQRCTSVVDLGCGDLTWISKTAFFNDDTIAYTGIDIAESLITRHSQAYPRKLFLNKDIVCCGDIAPCSLIILRDVIFHLSIRDVESLFRNIHGKFGFIAITSCKNRKNRDDFDQYHYTERNLHLHPFRISKQYIDVCVEPVFKRRFYIYAHDDFYNIQTATAVSSGISSLKVGLMELWMSITGRSSGDT